MTPNELVGKSYTFDDDSTITIIQVKKKEIDGEVGDMVTYTISQGNNLPRKLVMPYNTFLGTFGHLFET
jgi:hypothetical protein